MDGECHMYAGGQTCWENFKGRDHLEDLGLDDKHQNGCQDTGLSAEEWSGTNGWLLLTL
jgi:hypothetical protein